MKWLKFAGFTLCIFLQGILLFANSLNIDLSRYNELIESTRKIPVTIHIIDFDGRPLSNVAVHIEQKTHQFFFGNAPEYLIFAYARFNYMRGRRFGITPISAEKLEQYKSLYADLFNYATVPSFYWADYEPRKNTLPLLDASKQIIEWLNESGITVKGHTLAWGNSPGVGVPGWVRSIGESGNWQEVKVLLMERIKREINEFKSMVQMWDIVNEPIVQEWFNGIGDDYIFEAYKLAREIDPDAKLVLNEFGVLTNKNIRNRFINLAKRLIENDAPIDIIGIEAHIFTGEDLKTQLANLDGIYAALDEIAELGKPIHITEFQIPLPAIVEAFQVDTETAEKLQAEIAQVFYTVFFSHPAVEAIIYWNFYRAWQSGSGFLRDDFTVKPIYYALKELIQEKWRTSLNLTTNIDGSLNFRGFSGDYEIKVRAANKEKTFKVKVGKEACELILKINGDQE